MVLEKDPPLLNLFNSSAECFGLNNCINAIPTLQSVSVWWWWWDGRTFQVKSNKSSNRTEKSELIVGVNCEWKNQEKPRNKCCRIIIINKRNGPLNKNNWISCSRKSPSSASADGRSSNRIPIPIPNPWPTPLKPWFSTSSPATTGSEAPPPGWGKEWRWQWVEPLIKL